MKVRIDKMRKDKRKRYIESQRFAIHTLSGVFDKAINLDKITVDNKSVKDIHTRKKRNKGTKETYVQLNPNKLTNSELVLSYNEFYKAIEQIIEVGLNEQVKDFNISRCDFCFNSIDKTDFEDFQKLNKLLICCLAVTYNVENCYNTKDLWHDKTLSIAIKNQSLEAENYDKAYQTNGKSEYSNRLEFRSKRMNDTVFKPDLAKEICDEFLITWAGRLMKAITHFEEVQDKYNLCMREDFVRNRKLYRTIDDFVRCHESNFFTKQQLVNFYKSLGIPNAENKANNFKQRNKIEFFSMKDLEVVVSGLLDTAKEYFDR